MPNVNTLCPDALPFFDPYLAHLQTDPSQNPYIDIRLSWTHASPGAKYFIAFCDNRDENAQQFGTAQYLPGSKQLEFSVKLRVSTHVWFCKGVPGQIVFEQEGLFDLLRPVASKVRINVVTGLVSFARAADLPKMSLTGKADLSFIGSLPHAINTISGGLPSPTMPQIFSSPVFYGAKGYDVAVMLFEKLTASVPN